MHIYPSKVYLHRGTREGCKALKEALSEDLGRNLNCRSETLERKYFPEPIQELEPYEIEDFLCFYKDDFRGASNKYTKPQICY